MNEKQIVDVGFDTRSDAGDKDPDTFSPTLKEYHRLLWGKPLPDGRPFPLEAPAKRTRYLYHQSEVGEFFLASDTVIPTYRSWASPRFRPIPEIISSLPAAELDAFQVANHTIGGAIIFPGEKRPGVGQTMNGARGFRREVRDRFDLTLECIRRFYSGAGELNPLEATIVGYADFFELFGNFRAYVAHFLLDDLVTPAGDVAFFLPFDGFVRPALPQSVAEYREYRDASVDFISRRNSRIDAWARAHLA
ncbi:MAG: hypothetical protein ABI632_13810 [Pseudolysinimonas sp.]